MKRIVLAGAAAAFTGATLAASPAGASPVDRSHRTATGITIIAQGSTATGGWVEFTGEGEVRIDGRKADARGIAVSVGGGYWSYGSTRNVIGQKVCYSQYKHDSVWHGSSVKLDITASDWVGPKEVSDANVSRYTNSTCYAYWSKA